MRLIDADKLRKEVPLWLDGEVLVMPVDALDEAPEIEAEPVVHAHWDWIGTQSLELSYGATAYLPTYKCSNCNHLYESYVRYDEPTKEDADYPNYCEICGAKMDERGEK